jgi:hypothetical protein
MLNLHEGAELGIWSVTQTTRGLDGGVENAEEENAVELDTTFTTLQNSRCEVTRGSVNVSGQGLERIEEDERPRAGGAEVRLVELNERACSVQNDGRTMV